MVPDSDVVACRFRFSSIFGLDLSWHAPRSLRSLGFARDDVRVSGGAIEDWWFDENFSQTLEMTSRAASFWMVC